MFNGGSGLLVSVEGVMYPRGAESGPVGRMGYTLDPNAAAIVKLIPLYQITQELASTR